MNISSSSFRSQISGPSELPPDGPRPPGPTCPPVPKPIEFRGDGVDFSLARTATTETTVNCPEGTKPTVTPTGDNGVTVTCEKPVKPGRAPILE